MSGTAAHRVRIQPDVGVLKPSVRPAVFPGRLLAKKVKTCKPRAKRMADGLVKQPHTGGQPGRFLLVGRFHCLVRPVVDDTIEKRYDAPVQLEPERQQGIRRGEPTGTPRR